MASCRGAVFVIRGEGTASIAARRESLVIVLYQSQLELRARTSDRFIDESARSRRTPGAGLDVRRRVAEVYPSVSYGSISAV